MSAIRHPKSCLKHEMTDPLLRNCDIFTALHGMQTQSIAMRKLFVRLSVCLSVCLSNACIVTKRKKDLYRFLYHTTDHLAWSSEKKNGWWGDSSTCNFGSTRQHWSEIADFQPISARIAPQP